MAKATGVLKIDTTEAMHKMKGAAIEAQEAMRNFVDACAKIDIEEIKGEFSL